MHFLSQYSINVIKNKGLKNDIRFGIFLLKEQFVKKVQLKDSRQFFAVQLSSWLFSEEMHYSLRITINGKAFLRNERGYSVFLFFP